MEINNSKKIKMLQEIQSEIQKIKKEKLIMEPFVKDITVRMSWNSNSLEGNTLSLDETVRVIEYDEVRSGHTYTEYQEAKNVYHAIKTMIQFDEKQTMDADWVKGANGYIMGNEATYRGMNLYVGTLTEAVYYPPSYQDVPDLMHDFIEKMNINTQNIESLIHDVAYQHIQFERIHPFPDGNGRTGRMIMNQQLLNNGLLPAIIKDQSKYRQSFRRFDKNGEVALMENVMINGILESWKHMEKIRNKYEERFSPEKK
ncbi:MAG: Fic family protein [Hespellia sp.]|nr:Fic family protein [Hespellia sp.]